MAKSKRSRKNGDGSIIKFRRSGKIVAYAAELTIGWKDNKRIYVRGAKVSDLRVAEAMLLDLHDKRDAGELPLAPLAHNDGGATPKAFKTLGEYMEHWLSHHAPQDRRLKSVASYAWAIKRIITGVGEAAMRKLTLPALQTFLDTLKTKHGQLLAYDSVRLIKVVLDIALEQAEADGFIPSNPAKKLVVRGKKGQPKTFFHAKQAQVFLRELNSEPQELAMAMRVTLNFGTRRGETCALRWSNIDFKTNKITFESGRQYIPAHGTVEGPTKTNDARIFFMPPAISDLLRAHQEQQRAQRAMLPPTSDTNDDHVFFGVHGKPLSPGVLRIAVQRVGARIGLPKLTTHGLRYSTASILHHDRVPIKEIAAYLGHSSETQTAKVYVHIFQERTNENAARLDRLITPDVDTELEAQ